MSTISTESVYLTDRVQSLLAVPGDNRDEGWLRKCLQCAVDLEISTIPPYLCGLWSVAETGSVVTELIWEIVKQEMLHLGLACNMLAAIGGQPVIRAPVYPGPLPAGVRPGLMVHLQGLTPAYVHDVYMEIEYPESRVAARVEGPPTIGQFYDEILAEFQRIHPEVKGTHQISASGVELRPVTNKTEFEAAITTIKEQGEGTATSPDAVHDHGELAHYYRFGEMYNGRKLIKINNKWKYEGDPIPFPKTYPMAVVPQGGWKNTELSVMQLLETFRGAYTGMLDNLQQAWQASTTDDGGAKLHEAVAAMRQLAGPAIKLMGKTLPGSSLTYGPDFQATGGGATE